MMELDKVINGLEQMLDYSKYNDSVNWNPWADTETLEAALALLKAQEPVSPVKVNRYMDTDENGDWYVPETYDCGNCGVELHGRANYCHLCGRAVKWDD